MRVFGTRSVGLPLIYLADSLFRSLLVLCEGCEQRHGDHYGARGLMPFLLQNFLYLSVHRYARETTLFSCDHSKPRT